MSLLFFAAKKRKQETAAVLRSENKKPNYLESDKSKQCFAIDSLSKDFSGHCFAALSMRN
jgi:hypothetical protein